MRYHGLFRPEHDFAYAERAVKAGLAGFELYGWVSQFPRELVERYKENIRRIREELQAGLSVHAPIIDINLGSINPKIRALSMQEVKESLEFAREVGATAVVVHAAPGLLAMPEGKWSRETQTPQMRGGLAEQEELTVEAIKDLADFAPDLLICLENLVFPHEIYRSPQELQELVRKVNRSNVGITLDVGHAVIAGHDPLDFVRLLFDDLFHIHLHDNHGETDEHLPLGQGTIDYVGIVQTLKQLNYQGAITLEFAVEDPDQFVRYVHP